MALGSATTAGLDNLAAGIAKLVRGRVRTRVLDDWQRENERGSAARAADPRSLLRH